MPTPPAAATGRLFDDLADIYESLIDWPKRLAHEEPFFRQWFERWRARRVVDVACGSGHHAARFHAWGLEVEGADLSPAMIARARRAFGESPILRWCERGFEQPVAAPSSFDAAVCVGNSLALASDAAAAAQAVQQMFAAVRPGGGIVVHVLNLWSLPDGPCRVQKCRRLTLPGGEVMISKGVHRCGPRGFVDLIVTPLDAPARFFAESTPLLGFEAVDLEAMARAAGATTVAFFGGYQGQAYDRATSVDLILVAQ